jgi:Ca-activated chloride channel family protein
MIHRYLATTIIAALFVAPLAFIVTADSGFLIPLDRTVPDPSVLSLGEMRIDIEVQDGVAEVRIRQIFENHTSRVEEGVYHFALPIRAVLSGFAIWDDLVRIPGVIMERRRAGELYDSLRPRAVDPGLLQMGERTAQEAAQNSEFTARVMPIPAYGTKRIELEYHERVPVERFESVLSIPLEPDAYQAQFARRLDVSLTIESVREIESFQGVAGSYPLTIAQRGPNRIRATYSGTDVPLTEDFSIRYGIDPRTADTMRVVTYRDPSEGDGFFQASALFDLGGAVEETTPRVVVAVFDSSLSMQWEKLESSYHAFESVLRSLGPSDLFNVVVFNSEVSVFSPTNQPATLESVERGLEFVRQSRLRGSTDLDRALNQALEHAVGNAYVVLFSDGGSTSGAVANAAVMASFRSRYESIAADQRPRMFVFGVGDDANLALLGQLAADSGVSEWVRSTEPVEFKVQQFVSKIGRYPIGGLALSVSSDTVDQIYPLETEVFGGSEQVWVGRYGQPADLVRFEASGRRDGERVVVGTEAPLPTESSGSSLLPRTWARARVDFLLDEIGRNGETEEAIDEIIRLSREHTFVTPYTSFLAAPRSLLRPRVIRPGDPVIRIQTDPSITSVIAVFPFGLIKPLRYLDAEEVWQTRFLAPADMVDGTHRVDIVLRDDQGNAYREEKTFVVASEPPVVRARVDRTGYRPGETVRLRVGASETTRTIVARMYGVAPVPVRWNDQERSNVGEFMIPANLPPGEYRVVVTAEDFAHNVGTGEVTVEVVP